MVGSSVRGLSFTSGFLWSGCLRQGTSGGIVCIFSVYGGRALTPKDLLCVSILFPTSSIAVRPLTVARPIDCRITPYEYGEKQPMVLLGHLFLLSL